MFSDLPEDLPEPMEVDLENDTYEIEEKDGDKHENINENEVEEEGKDDENEDREEYEEEFEKEDRGWRMPEESDEEDEDWRESEKEDKEDAKDPDWRMSEDSDEEVTNSQVSQLRMTPERLLNFDYYKISYESAATILSDRDYTVSASTVRRHRIDVRNAGKEEKEVFLYSTRRFFLIWDQTQRFTNGKRVNPYNEVLYESVNL